MSSVETTTPLRIDQFAYRVAGPRDFVINLVINSVIPWLVFRGMDAVPLTGWHSVASVVLPMTFILSTLTTFFGYFNGIKERRAGTVVPGLEQAPAWAGLAWRRGLICGAVGLAAVSFLTSVVQYGFDPITIPPWAAIGGLGLYAGFMGYFLHSHAVVRSGEL